MPFLKILKYSVLFICLTGLLNVKAAVGDFRHIPLPRVSGLMITNITQDSQGQIWISTDHGLYIYDGLNYRHVLFPQVGTDIYVDKVLTVNNGDKWIVTRHQGIYRINHEQQINKLELGAFNLSDTVVYDADLDSNGGLWIASKAGLLHYTATGNFNHHLVNSTITRVNILDQQKAILGMLDGAVLFSLNTLETKEMAKKTGIVLSILEHNNHYYIGSQNGVYKSLGKEHQFTKLLPEQLDDQVLTMTSYKGELWIGTSSKGIYVVDDSPQIIHQFSYEPGNSDSLSSNQISQMYIDANENLWVSTFDNQIDLLPLRSLSFGYQNYSLNSLYCAKSNQFNDLLENQNVYWLANDQALIKYNPKLKTCDVIDRLKNGEEAFQKNTILSMVQTDEGLIILGTLQGLMAYDPSDNVLYKIAADIPYTINFIQAHDENKLLIGTKQGLYTYQMGADKTSLINLSNNLEYIDIIQSHEGYHLLTQAGIEHLSFDASKPGIQQLYVFENSVEPTALHIDAQKHFWIGTIRQGALLFDQNFHPLTAPIPHNESISVYALVSDLAGFIWAGTSHGLMKINPETMDVGSFKYPEIQNRHKFQINAAKNINRKIFFGSKQGFNYFNPNDIETDEYTHPIIISKLFHLHETVEPNKNYGQFSIDQHINLIEQIELTHEDYIIGFELVLPEHSQLADAGISYQLEGFHSQWHHSKGHTKQITFTDLPSGEYTLRLKGVNDSGIESQEKHLKILVHPPFWLTWWAFLGYLALLINLIAWYTNNKIKKNKILAQQLQIKVNEQTNELKSEKQKVESLLLKKNNLFSHVTHEFRTPLTLILGPINLLIKESHSVKSEKSLQLIKNNANRLLSLVDQLLHFARISDVDDINYSQQASKQQIESIFDAFLFMADKKKLQYKLVQNDEATVEVTEHFFDVVLGNIISNAIKYSQPSGEVTIKVYVENQALNMLVTDTGMGLDQHQSENIFKRFTRLDVHQNIDGVGIGLSIVKDVVEINHGKITVQSEPGVGSQFKVTVPLSNSDGVIECPPTEPKPHDQITWGAQQTIQPIGSSTLDEHKYTVLIIEDNQDMRAFIKLCIEDDYNVIMAENGKKGIAKAIEFIPDIILCDVMMPVMDGYKVSRLIRHDERTSHIPLMLLTALTDKVSRVKGWREQVDAYMTKPFDQGELLMQLSCMLSIRDILSKKAGDRLSKSTPNHPDLTKIDQKFIEKLINVINKHYQNPLLSREILAAEMAISERQLLRKTKALLNLGPMDVLRENRLAKSLQLVKDGYRINVIADECGFNSLSYFSNCFKAQYGLSPKQYQLTQYKNTDGAD